jgi:hypothetical protein
VTESSTPCPSVLLPSVNSSSPVLSPVEQRSEPFHIVEDERLTTPALRKLAKVFWELRLPLKFKIVEDQLKLGRYTGTQMRKIFQHADEIFSCCPYHDLNIWVEFNFCLTLLTENPPQGETRHSVALLFKERFQAWKELFLGQAGNIDPEWRIYFHILDCHGGDLYEKFGNLHPWANEAGEHLHALDRMFFFQRSRKGTHHGLATKVLTTGLRVRFSHHRIGNYQVPSDIPEEIKKAKPLSARTSRTHSSLLVE